MKRMNATQLFESLKLEINADDVLSISEVSPASSYDDCNACFVIRRKGGRDFYQSLSSVRKANEVRKMLVEWISLKK